MPITAAANKTYIKVYLLWTKSHYLPAKYLHNNTDIYIQASSFMKGKQVTYNNKARVKAGKRYHNFFFTPNFYRENEGSHSDM